MGTCCQSDFDTSFFLFSSCFALAGNFQFLGNRRWSVDRYTSHTPYLNACSCSQFVCTASTAHSRYMRGSMIKIPLHSKKSRSISRAMSHAMTHATRSTSSSSFSSVAGPIPPRRLITSTTPCADPRKPQGSGNYRELPPHTKNALSLNIPVSAVHRGSKWLNHGQACCVSDDVARRQDGIRCSRNLRCSVLGTCTVVDDRSVVTECAQQKSLRQNGCIQSTDRLAGTLPQQCPPPSSDWSVCKFHTSNAVEYGAKHVKNG